MRPEMVEIQKDDLRGKVAKSSVPAWERRGWTLVDDGSSESGKEPEAPAPDEPPRPRPVEVVVESDQNEGGDQ